MQANMAGSIAQGASQEGVTATQKKRHISTNRRHISTKRRHIANEQESHEASSDKKCVEAPGSWHAWLLARILYLCLAAMAASHFLLDSGRGSRC
jgi:hypothetical protein